MELLLLGIFFADLAGWIGTSKVLWGDMGCRCGLKRASLELGKWAVYFGVGGCGILCGGTYV
jgi:hypothetical protein